MTRLENARVQVDAHVIRQLGDQLVTDAEQALLELVKNSYDADATWVHVTVDTKDGDSQGVISIEDNGIGMDLDMLKRGWLIVSLSPKREMKAKGLKTARQRTPLGDKGLGRLATMKLGSNLEILTHSRSSKPGCRLTLNWDEFVSGKTLADVPVPIDEAAALPRSGTGTTVRVRNLETPEYWIGTERAKSLETSLSLLVTPFETIEDFRISLTLEGQRINLAKLSTELRDTATARFSFTWDDRVLRCEGLLKLNIFRAQRNDGFDEFVASDQGAALVKHFKEQPFADSFELRRAKGGPWFLRVSNEWTWQDIRKSSAYADLLKKPGPFHGELDSFELDSEEGTEIFSSQKDYRAYVKAHAGIRVYRNGFAIRMPEDWLGLGRTWTTGRGYYSLKPVNTLGYISISSDKNELLVEKSDRESFMDTPESRGFMQVLKVYTGFCNDVLNHLRRSAGVFKDAEQAKVAKLPASWTPGLASEKIAEIAKTAKQHKKALKETDKRREASARRIQGDLDKLAKDSRLPNSLRADAARTLKEANSLLEEWDTRRSEMEAALAAIEDEGAVAKAVFDRFETLERQIDEVYETVALGLAARAFAHDVNSLLDDLLARTGKITRQLGRNASPALTAYIESVRAIVATLRKQLNYIEPMLRRSRESKQTIKLAEFVREFFELRAERLTRLGIAPRIEVAKDATVVMNRGRLVQILDNLVRNSEYWLAEKDTSPAGAAPEIRIRIDAPRLVISDNGPGVRAGIEGRVFDIFVSDKPKTEGTGLGLFIVRELLQREGCSIVLLPERNAANRRYQFAIDLSGVVR
jgi:signal transduction histidine kinase